METKQGILKYIAGSAAKGVKFKDEPNTWYNPSSEEVKEQIKDEYKGRMVDIVLVEGKKTVFSSMELSEEPTGEDAVVTEEKIDEEPEEKVTPPKEEEDVIDFEKELYAPGQISDMLGQIKSNLEQRQYTKATYKEMEGTKLETAKKGPLKLTYASWAEAWGSLKRIHPTAQFHVHENKEGLPVFYNEDFPMMGGFVKVTVKVKGLEHTVHLPVMNHANKSMKLAEMTTFDINKNIQRALVKAIAYHGLGLYVFKGEEFNDE